MNSYIEILGCDGTALYDAKNHQMEFHSSGRLQVLLSFDGLVMLKLNDFEHQVNPKEEIVVDKFDPQFEMVFYFKKYGSGKWVFKINEHADEVFSCLNEKCYVRDKDSAKSFFSGEENKSHETSEVKKIKENKVEEVKVEKKIKNEKKKAERKTFSYSYGEPEEDKSIEEENKEEKKSITAKDVLVGASKGLGIGLAFTGKVFSKGFEAIGTLASKVVKPAANKVEISEASKANLDLAKKTSKTVLTFTATQVGNLFTLGKETASNIGERFEKTEKGQEMQENPKYNNIKEGTKTGVKVFANVYDGVVTAVYEMGSGISKGTSKVVGKKYGEEAGQAADEAMEGFGNVIKIARVPTDEAYKAFK